MVARRSSSNDWFSTYY